MDIFTRTELNDAVRAVTSIINGTVDVHALHDDTGNLIGVEPFTQTVFHYYSK